MANINANFKNQSNLCDMHTQQIIELGNKIDNIHKDMKDANDQTFTLLTKLVDNNISTQNKTTNFYIKIISACIVVGGTIVLTAFGIKQIITFF